MPKEPRTHHYVPRFLLRNFSVESNQIWVFDKKEVRTFPASIENVAQEKDFYTYAGKYGKIRGEGATSKADSLAADIISHIKKTEKFPSDVKSRNSLLHYTAFQFLRTPFTRIEAKKSRDFLIEKFGSNFRYGNQPISELDDDFDKAASIKNLDNAPQYAALLNDKIPVIHKAPVHKNLIISDNPVTLRHMGNKILALGHNNIEIYFPITPSLSIGFIGRSLANKIAKELNRKHDFVTSVKENTPYLLKEENVDFLNWLQVSLSERYLYASKESDFDKTYETLALAPQMKKGPALDRVIEDFYVPGGI